MPDSDGLVRCSVKVEPVDKDEPSKERFGKEKAQSNTERNEAVRKEAVVARVGNASAEIDLPDADANAVVAVALPVRVTARHTRSFELTCELKYRKKSGEAFTSKIAVDFAFRAPFRCTQDLLPLSADPPRSFARFELANLASAPIGTPLLSLTFAAHQR